MTQKTNQFNLTTKRYTDADIKGLLSFGWKIWCLSVSDRFGDNGITGCIIINGDEIDSFLLSCRVLGKGIENAFLKSVLTLLKESGLESVRSFYRPTAKNTQVADFYDRNGFLCTAQEEDGRKSYIIALKDIDLTIEEYYHIHL